MRLRIIRPLPQQLEGFQLSHLKFGACYDINAPLCDLMLLMGYGYPEDEPTVDSSRAIKAFGTAIVAGDKTKKISKMTKRRRR